MRKSCLKNIGVLAVWFVMTTAYAERMFVHPGLSHKQSDLERMKLQVEAGKDPWLATYKLMEKSSKAGYDYKVRGTPGQTTLSNHSPFIGDGFAAYYNALMWNITGDERHAKKCVEIFNAWSDLKRCEDQFPLNNGRGPWKMLEGAEIIRSTYSGWAQADIDKFKAMLVYPGWSGTEVPTAAIASKDCTFYWNIYQGDPARHGNQGLFAYRSLMAMAIFCDNEIMYDRALRYLKGLPHRPDDLPYPSGPPELSKRLESSNEFYDEFRQLSRDTRQEDYGYNEVIEHYIYENGQCQESARDQAHALGGVSITACLCEMAWSQGDDLYGHLDNRVLTGLEFYFRYNLSYKNPYPDQLTPWEPTVKSGEFIKRSDRTGRWASLKINPWVAHDLERPSRGLHNFNGIYEMNLGHYKDRLLLPGSQTKWLERGFQLLTDKMGVEDDAHAVDHPGWGGIKFRRVSPGDPIRGFDAHGLPLYAMHQIPCIIEAENYDYFAINGEGRTYHDTTKGNRNGAYRDDDVDIVALPGGGFALSQMETGEWFTYTVSVPEDGNYEIAVRYAARQEGSILLGFKGGASTGVQILPVTGRGNWATHVIGRTLLLKQGVQQMKVMVAEGESAYILDHISIQPLPMDVPPAAPKVESPVRAEEMDVREVVSLKNLEPSVVQNHQNAENTVGGQLTALWNSDRQWIIWVVVAGVGISLIVVLKLRKRRRR